MSNSKIKLTGQSFADKVSQFEEISQEMETLFFSIEKDIKDLSPYWETKASELEFEEFRNFFDQLHAINNMNKTYSNFLRNTVITSHEELGKKINNAVDESLDIRE